MKPYNYYNKYAFRGALLAALGFVLFNLCLAFLITHSGSISIIFPLLTGIAIWLGNRN
jgi:uncharacterized BrkB/YihY/UPF0761 family membrane protein